MRLARVTTAGIGAARATTLAGAAGSPRRDTGSPATAETTTCSGSPRQVDQGLAVLGQEHQHDVGRVEHRLVVGSHRDRGVRQRQAGAATAALRGDSTTAGDSPTFRTGRAIGTPANRSRGRRRWSPHHQIRPVFAQVLQSVGERLPVTGEGRGLPGQRALDDVERLTAVMVGGDLVRAAGSRPAGSR